MDISWTWLGIVVLALIIFSFYSDFGFYTVRPGRLERSAKAFLL